VLVAVVEEHADAVTTVDVAGAQRTGEAADPIGQLGIRPLDRPIIVDHEDSRHRGVVGCRREEPIDQVRPAFRHGEQA
jgi:hypothetical protein